MVDFVVHLKADTWEFPSLFSGIFLFSIGQIPAPAPNSMTHNHMHKLCVLVEE